MNLRTFTLSLALLVFGFVQAQPGQPVLLAPADSAASTSLTPTLDWESIAADSFMVVVSENADLSSPVISMWTMDSNSQYSIATPLNALTTHYWAIAASLNDTIGMYSDTFSFTTQGVPPAVPDLVSPISASIDLPQRPTLEWTASAGATKYRLWVSTFNNFADTAYYIELTTTSHTLASDLDADKAYFWRVAAENAQAVSDYSYYWNFSTLYTSISPIHGIDLGLEVYPNPAQDAANVSFASQAGGNYSVQVFDLNGKAMLSAITGTSHQENTTLTLDLNGLNSGIYMVQLTLNGQVQNLKLSIR